MDKSWVGRIVLAVVLVTATAGITAAATVTASLDNRALLDTNADELGNTNFAPTSGGVAVGEQNSTPPATAEMKYWLPFALTDAQRALIAHADAVELNIQLRQKQNVAAFNADIIGLTGRTSTTAVNSDYQAAGVTVVDDACTAATPTGMRTYDVTAFAQAQAAVADSVLAFRVENDNPALLPDGDASRNNYIFETQDNSTVAKRPTLTIVIPPVTRLADTFDDGTLLTAPGNGGFIEVGNHNNGVGTVTEAGGLAQIATATGSYNNHGIVSVHAVDTDFFGAGSRIEATWVIDSQTGVGANSGNTFFQTELLLQSGMDFREAPYLKFDIEDGGQWALVANDGSGDVTLYDGGGLVGGVPDGYEITITADLFGWTIEGTGFSANPSASGLWPAGFSPAAGDLYAAAMIQHQTDGNAATLNVDSIDVRVTEIPEPITLTALALAGSGLAGYLRRRRLF